jgi:hypothetical protein
VAIDPNAPPASAPPERSPVIDNEIPAYRAISPMAVVSLLLGLLSALSFASPTFLLAGAGAIVLGLLADRKIKKLPDILTGRKLAQAGIGLGLAFALSSLTIGGVQDFLLSRKARAAAQRFGKVLKEQTVADAIWWKSPPSMRKSTSPEDLVTSMKQQMRDPSEYEGRIASITATMNRLKEDASSKIEVVSIERQGYEGLVPYAHALLKIAPPSHDGHVEEDYALVQMKADPNGGANDWWVEEIVFPYKPGSMKEVVKSIEASHGHGGGGHSH